MFLNNIIVVKFHDESSFFCRMAEKSGDNPGRSEGKVRRLKWDNDNMKAAKEAVSSGEMTVSASSRVFNPGSTNGVQKPRTKYIQSHYVNTIGIDMP